MASDWSISYIMLWCLQKLSWGGITLHLSVTQNWHSYMYPLTSILLSLRKQIWPWTYRRLNWQRVSHITTYPLQTPTVFGGVRVVLCSCLCCVAFFCFFFVFILCLVYSVLSVSLDCLFLIAPSVLFHCCAVLDKFCIYSRFKNGTPETRKWWTAINGDINYIYILRV